MLKKITSNIYIIVVASALLISFASCSDSATNTAKSPEKKILSFRFEGITPNAVGIIDESAKTIIVAVSPEIEISALVPVITISDKARISPAPGLAQDFRSEKLYTVTAEDGTSAQYSVTVGRILPAVISESRAYNNINTGSDYFIESKLNIKSGAVVTFQVGCVIQFLDADGAITVEDNAALKITGSAGKPVAFIGSGHNMG
jgi:hypothetical protein